MMTETIIAAVARILWDAPLHRSESQVKQLSRCSIELHRRWTAYCELPHIRWMRWPLADSMKKW